MRIDVVTLFPEMFAPLEHSIVRRARAAGQVQIELHQLRAWTTDRHHVVDDVPYGGGSGMVMKPEPVFAAVRAVRAMAPEPAHVVLTSPQGVPLRQPLVEALARRPRLLVLCGHYEGVDERVREALVDEEISLGDFVLTGGEIPAMAMVDAVVRLLPGVLDAGSLVSESFTRARLDHPHYTRPRCFEGREVPAVLLSGNHAAIDRWRRREATLRTWRRRPELFAEAPPTAEERAWIEAADPESGAAPADG